MHTITAIYPGTFDPITYGHIDLAKRAAALFNRLIVAVAVSDRKAPFFALTDRLKMVKELFAEIENIEVVSFEGLLVNFAKEKNAQVIVRGLRSASDIELEFQLASMNRAMHKTIETMFLVPAAEYAHISSTIVREIAIMKGDLTPFVPPNVIAEFAEVRK